MKGNYKQIRINSPMHPLSSNTTLNIMLPSSCTTSDSVNILEEFSCTEGMVRVEDVCLLTGPWDSSALAEKGDFALADDDV